MGAVPTAEASVRPGQGGSGPHPEAIGLLAAEAGHPGVGTPDTLPWS